MTTNNWKEWIYEQTLEQEVKEELSFKRAQQEIERNYIGEEEIVYSNSEMSQEDIDRLCEAGYQQYLESQADKVESVPATIKCTYPAKLFLVSLVLVLMSGCAGGRVYIGFEAENSLKRESGYTMTPDQARERAVNRDWAGKQG